MKNKLFSLIGCGWLGKRLLETLVAEGLTPIVTTAHDKLTEFKSEHASYVQLDLALCPAVPSELLKSEVLIYLIPPLALPFIQNFFDQIPRSKKIIFISSTSIYGKNMGDVDENTFIDPGVSNSTLLLKTEEYLKERFTNLTILRTGGLYGKKRHPITHLSGRTNLKTGNEYLHLAHQDDCVKAIMCVLEQEIWNETFNIISDLRIKKNVFYHDMAKKLDLPPPQYSEAVELSNETKISNEKSKSRLHLKYIDPNEFCTFSE